MTFDVAADRYQQFMGRYSEPLAAELIRLVDPRPGTRVADVGCGPGAVTALLVDRLGPRAVGAIDPSEPFIASVHQRFPDVDVRCGVAEHLPWVDGAFDVTLAQLVVHFMSEPLVALREMARVTRAGGVVAASVWDYEGGRSPLSPFWQGVAVTAPDHPGEADLTGARAGQLAALFASAGLRNVEQSELVVRVPVPGFDDWWEPFTFGVGPAGAYYSSLSDADKQDLRERCRGQFPDGPFEVVAAAWLATGCV